MKAHVANEYEFRVEVRRERNLFGVPLFSADATADLAELVDEVFTRGVLSETLPVEADRVNAAISLQWLDQPIVRQLTVTIEASTNGSTKRYAQTLRTGRWERTAQAAVATLIDDEIVGKDDVVYVMLLALQRDGQIQLPVPTLQPPTIVDRRLEELGVRSLAEGRFVADRPVLLSERLVADSVDRCEAAGTSETGGAVLGSIVRLPERLPGTQTRIVTVLSTLVEDPRHAGAPLSFFFSPEALADAAQMAELRGLGETVQTVYHTHGWAPTCAGCEKNGTCPLASATPSLQDYQVVESLLSSKATLLPIGGRNSGVQTQRPSLLLWAWRGGKMRPLRWRTYEE